MIPIFPAPGQVDLNKGANLEFGFRLLGPLQSGEMESVLGALEGLRAFEFGSERGRVEFAGATIVGRRESPIVVDSDSAGVERIEIVFETLTWLEHEGHLMETMVFRSFFRAIYRRLTVLCALYGTLDERDDEAFARLDEFANGILVEAHEVKALEWQRRSLARGREHAMQGVLGRVVFGGKRIGAFLPMLRLAEKTHIGRSTSFGQGRMRLRTVT